MNVLRASSPKIEKMINIYNKGEIDIKSKKILLVLGDLHGNIKSAIITSILIQEYYGYNIDSIFQVGDFGYWPRGVASKNTDPNYKKDDSLDFFEIQNSIDTETYFKLGQTSLETLKAPIYFIRGNHEDFEFINQLSQHNLTNLINEHFYYIPDYFMGNISEINLAAVGGILTDVYRGRGAKARENLKKNKQKLEWDKRLSDASNLTSFTAGNVDILLTHSGLAYRENRHGSKQLEEFLCQSGIPLHFHGHHHRFVSDIIGDNTLSIGLKNYDINNEYKVNEGCFALVEWTDNKNFCVYINYPKNVS